MLGIINGIIKALGTVLSWLLGLLPNSPFQYTETFDSGWLAAINWIFPVASVLTHLASFLLAVGVWYGIRVIARWVKAAGA